MSDFSRAFSNHRNQAGSPASNGNPKAATFVGTAISMWNTTSATSLFYTFYGASEMNADLTGWKVGKVVALGNTFTGASKFTGTGLSAWDVAKVTSMTHTFTSTTSLTTCNKRKIADAWKSSAAFTATTYDTDWAADACPCTAGSTWSATGNDPCTTCTADSTCTTGVKTACATTADTLCMVRTNILDDSLWVAYEAKTPHKHYIST